MTKGHSQHPPHGREVPPAAALVYSSSPHPHKLKTLAEWMWYWSVYWRLQIQVASVRLLSCLVTRPHMMLLHAPCAWACGMPARALSRHVCIAQTVILTLALPPFSPEAAALVAAGNARPWAGPSSLKGRERQQGRAVLQGRSKGGAAGPSSTLRRCKGRSALGRTPWASWRRWWAAGEGGAARVTALGAWHSLSGTDS